MKANNFSKLIQNLEYLLQLATQNDINSVVLTYSQASEIHDLLLSLGNSLKKSRSLCDKCQFNCDPESDCGKCKQYSKEKVCCKCVLLSENDICTYFEPRLK